MIPLTKPSNETARLQALRDYQILDTSSEQVYDDITQLASYICGAPIALISFVDESRQWLKSKKGLDVNETTREVSFCTHAILTNDVMVVPNAKLDERFATNPLVTGDPKIVFYAGAPLIDKDGFALGSLCVIDRISRQLSDAQLDALRTLSRQTVTLLEMRRVSAALSQALENVKILRGMLPICSYCKRIRDDHGYWIRVEDFIHNNSEATFTHGACQECANQVLDTFRASKK